MSLVVLHLLVILVFVGRSRGYVEMTPVLQMLNIPWEGECPVAPSLRLHPELQRLGWAGRCPTVYRVLELPSSSEPRAILEGFCDPSCHNTQCGSLGNFRCRNHTVPVDVASLQFTEEGEVVKVIRTENIPVGCVCQSRRHTKLGSFSPYTAD